MKCVFIPSLCGLYTSAAFELENSCDDTLVCWTIMCLTVYLSLDDVQGASKVQFSSNF